MEVPPPRDGPKTMVDLNFLRGWVFGVASSVTICLSAAETKPNIVLIMADDVGTDAIGCYGGESYPTPHIDALAASGMRFNHAYAMPVCHPSRICLMTGRYPFRFGDEGSKWGDFPSAAEGISIGNRMQRGGYATAVAGKWQICFMKDDLDHPRRVGFDEWCLFGWHEGGRYHDPLIYQNGELRTDTAGQYGPNLYVEFLIDFMQRSHNAGKPFFAYYPMALCHDVTDDLQDKQVAYFKDGRWMTYGEMVASMDDMVGRVVNALERMGIRDNTLLLFTTDNGTAGVSYLTIDGEGQLVRPRVVSVRDGKVVPGGKGKLDDSGTRVPLIARWPGRIIPGREVDQMVDLTDYLPTLAEVADLPDDGVPRDGVSFAPVLQGSPQKAEMQRAGTRTWIYLEHQSKRCVRTEDWKLYDDGRFFDLRSDPGESRSLGEDRLTDRTSRKHVELTRILGGLKGPILDP
jgi:arylsulfatase A